MDKYRAFRSDVNKHIDHVDALEKKMDRFNQEIDSRVRQLEGSMLPAIDSQNKRRKVDYADLKAWLLDSIDERMKKNEKKLEKTVDKKYKSTVLQQKSEISDLKREVSAISGTSPLKSRLSRGVADEQVIDEHNDDPSMAAESVNAEERKARKSTSMSPSLTRFVCLDTSESNQSFSYKKVKGEMDQIEKYIIESGDEIGAQLDQHKISIYDWNDKIVKVVKQIEKLRKKGKNNSANKAEIQSKPCLQTQHQI